MNEIYWGCRGPRTSAFTVVAAVLKRNFKIKLKEMMAMTPKGVMVKLEIKIRFFKLFFTDYLVFEW